MRLPPGPLMRALDTDTDWPLVFPAVGLITVSLILIGTIIVLLFDLTIIEIFAPYILFEFAIGIWLIVKGFRPQKIN